MIILDRIVYIFRHKNTDKIVSIWGSDYETYRNHGDYVHVGTVNPLAWIAHYWDMVGSSGSSLYIYKSPSGNICAIPQEQHAEYKNDPEWRLIERIDDYIDWVEKNYKIMGYIDED